MMSREEVLKWLHEIDPQRLAGLYAQADAVRKTCVGDEIHLRGLVEISNHCLQNCAYCGLRRDNIAVERYRMSESEIMECVCVAVSRGYGTIVLQSGEDYGLGADWVAGLVRRIKAETPLAVTLSLGERFPEELAAWRGAGTDRYLLKFETSDDELYERIHPALPNRVYSRKGLLRILKELGYEVGSGIMIGLPGQSYDALINDLFLFREMGLDMIGAGPFLPHPETPLGQGSTYANLPEGEQVPSTEEMAYKVIALTRILCPDANIPGTTSLASLNREAGRKLALQRGANVVMPNLTPATRRRCYEIYPEKLCFHEDAEFEHAQMKQLFADLGRPLGKGPGGRRGGSCTCAAKEMLL
ncbi:MAG TPA: [FeFe] hydrogenase H-cluster radical SAM maturase HydE [Dissulfurispiraceae bacterium]|nr:[FeFe] hydrogenase H-cluster radical SAM maturase HydE [Dissulfurispiraceae bacterium]